MTEEKPPEGAEPEQLCALCARAAHLEVATEPDEFGLLCPGSSADETARESYLYQRAFLRDKQTFTDKEHWDQLNTELSAAEAERTAAIERGEGRAEITHDDLVTHASAAVAALRSDQEWAGNKWLDIGPTTSREQIEAQLRQDELAEGLYVDPPHLTVPGKSPAPKPLITPRDAVEFTEGDKETAKSVPDYMLFVNTNPDK